MPFKVGQLFRKIRFFSTLRNMGLQYKYTLDNLNTEQKFWQLTVFATVTTDVNIAQFV